MLSDDELPPLPTESYIGEEGLWERRVVLTEESVREYARAVERAAYERAAQECIKTAAELRRCANGCTDGRYDWKADGADDCADTIRALGRQHD